MSKIIGRQDSIGIGKESSRGSAIAASYWVPWMELKLDSMVDTVTNEASLGVLESSDAQAITRKFGEATIKTKIKDKHFGLLLLSLLGTDTPVAKAGGNSAVYDHTFSVAQSTQHQSLTISHKNLNENERFANAVVDTIKISAKPGDYAYYEAKLMSFAGASASNTVAHSQENDFLASMMTFKKATTQAGLTAATAIGIREMTMEISQNIMPEYVLGTVAPNDFLTQDISIKGSVTLVHNDTTFLDMQNNETYNAFRFDLINTGVTIGASANPELQIDLHRIRVTNYDKKRKLNNIIEESFDFTAHYSLTDAKMITLVLTNLVASY